ncbi:hypothetical protein COOONC_04954 [Cooperia oncophora]
MRNVSKLLHSTDPRIITNYVFIRYVSSWSGELGERFDDVSQVSHITKTYGPQYKRQKQKPCTRTDYAASAIYVSKVFDKASKNSTLDMANDIKEAFHGMLVEEDWMDNATKKVLFPRTKTLPLNAVAWCSDRMI